jgi:tRNA dimethylallyltransferase
LKPTLISVVGPTAIGKTSLAISLAKKMNCEIVSCDSRQFYKEMKIGTAVPTIVELEQIRHHFIQHISIHDSYNVGDFEKDALDTLKELFKKNQIQIMVGGSGLYVDAVVKGLDTFPEIQAEIRKLVRDTYHISGLSYLQKTLKEKDPLYFQYLEINNPQTLKNPQRLMRFIEVCLGSGKPYSEFINKKKQSRDFNVITIGLEAPKDIMHERINDRVDLMISDGLVDEVERLLPNLHLNALQTVGYRELFPYLEGEIDLNTAVEEIKKNTRRFAKRQLTWFKRNPETIWFQYDTSQLEILETLHYHLKNAHS